MDPGYMDNTPVRPPPPGQVSNFTNPESRSRQVYILIAVLSAVIVLLIPSRIYSRLKITRSLGADGWLCIAATVRLYSLLPSSSQRL
ncbi:Uu.00g067890.m01.CDS01 [Anthostomella pinea]|uniref:Uu.00g067890.m01.CDS01 n=1 Tax=Anthostomella pinea TaxID=933095 RepID=A0AAI8YNA7_9PEZI|nr:Uu.00g067890.m01.CDS01 [Anthostomella pinea]